MNAWNAIGTALPFRNNEEEVVRIRTLAEWISGFQEVRIFTTHFSQNSKIIKESSNYTIMEAEHEGGSVY
jgi:hypothetical protein